MLLTTCALHIAVHRLLHTAVESHPNVAHTARAQVAVGHDVATLALPRIAPIDWRVVFVRMDAANVVAGFVREHIHVPIGGVVVIRAASVLPVNISIDPVPPIFVADCVQICQSPTAEGRQELCH